MDDLFTTISAPNGTTWKQPLGLFINNEFERSHSGKKIATINPSNEREIASVFAAGESDVDSAVKAAQAALQDEEWTGLSSSDRGKLLFKLADAIEQHQETLATIESMDNGKPFSVALHDDLHEVISTIRYYAGWADKISGQTIVSDSKKFGYTIRQPIGVVAQIIPWNFPLSMAAWKLGPALACGNTVVLKAAEQTPLSILYLGSLISESGFPPGVVNIINGYGAEAGTALVKHPGVDKVAFTGSTATGQRIMQAASLTMKNITLETGGKSPLVVFDDADVSQAAKWAHMGIMYNQGQVCSATSRILVQAAVFDEFAKSFKEFTEATSVVGDPFAEDTFQGPQVTRQQYERVLSYIESGKAEGATVLTGGQDLRAARGGGAGYYIAPTIFTDVKSSMRVYAEEIFGPVAVIVKFETEDEAIAIANESEYGLAAALFTKDVARSHRVTSKLQAGTVWVNSSNDLDIRLPFGGVKQSGIGRELGEAGLEAYTQVKAVHVNVGSKL